MQVETIGMTELEYKARLKQISIDFENANKALYKEYAASNNPYKVGDIFYGLPYHVCPTVALYERVFTIEKGKVTGEWKNVSRDRKISL